MKALVLTANEIRHNYFIQTVSERFDLVGVIKQPKKMYYEKSLYKTNFMQEHFKLLSKAEKKWLGNCDSQVSGSKFYKCDQYQTDNINSKRTLEWAKKRSPDVILLFGTRILDPIWMKSFNNIVNLHLGLAPYYRGSATLFWPFVNRQLDCVGVTLHLTIEDVDAGPILSRIKPPIEPGDNYYDINYKAIKAGIDGMPDTVDNYINGRIEPTVQRSKKYRRVYRKKDFNEQALKQALEFIGTGITKKQIQKAKEESKCKFLQ